MERRPPRARCGGVDMGGLIDGMGWEKESGRRKIRMSSLTKKCGREVEYECLYSYILLLIVY